MVDRSLQDHAFVPLSRPDRLAVLALIGLMLAGIGAFNLSEKQPHLTFVFIAFTTYTLVLSVPFVLNRPTWGWFHPIVFVVIWWQLVRHVIPRLGVYATGLDYHRVIGGAAQLEMNAVVGEELLLCSIGLLAFYVPFFGRSALPVLELRFGPPRYSVPKLIAVALLSLLALLLLARQAGGFDQLLLLRGLPGELREEFIEDLGGRHWQFLAGLLTTACLVRLALEPEIWRKPTFLFLSATGLGCDFLATGSRSGVVLPLLIAGTICILHYRRIRYGAVAIAAALTLLTIGVGGEFRQKSRGAVDLADLDLEHGLYENLQAGLETVVAYSTETDGTFGILARVPEEVDFLLGRSYLATFVAPIPAALLPFEKPKAGGKLTAIHVFGNPYTAIPPGNIGEAYWNFHIPGVVMVMLLFGVISNWFATLYRKNGAAGWVLVIYVLTLFGLQPNSPAIYDWFQSIVPAALLLFLLCGPPTLAGVARRRPGSRCWK